MKNFIYSIIIISGFLFSCSEYPEAIEPETDQSKNSINANVFPVQKIKQIKTDYKITTSETLNGKPIEFSGLYHSTKSYQEDGSILEHGTLFLDTPIKSSDITFSKSSELWSGNFAIENLLIWHGSLLQKNKEFRSSKVYTFKNEQIQQINVVNTSKKIVFTFDKNSARISSLSDNLMNVKNDMKLNFDEKGYLNDACVSSRVVNQELNINLERANNEIQHIRFESQGNLIGTLSFEYDNQFNPFAIHHKENSEIIKSIFAITMAELNIDDSKSIGENALEMAKHLSLLSNFSETNVLAIRWNNNLILTKSYTYNSAGYPTKIIIDSKMAIEPKILALYEELNFTLKGSDTISYY